VLVLSAPGGWLGGLTGNEYLSWAVYLVGAGQLTVADSIVQANLAERGGGVSAAGVADLALERCVLTANSAFGSGGGVAVSGSAEVSMEGGAVGDNQAGRNGGGLAVVDAAVANLTAVEFKGNAALGCGGAISTASPQPLLLGSSVSLSHNRAEGNGGALCLLPWSSNTSCLAISTAIANKDGGGKMQAVLSKSAKVTARSNFAQGGGGGIFFGCTGPPGLKPRELFENGTRADGWNLLNNSAGYGSAVASMPVSLVSACLSTLAHSHVAEGVIES
jgi:hypothetical protein